LYLKVIANDLEENVAVHQLFADFLKACDLIVMEMLYNTPTEFDVGLCIKLD
jgi:hypothetical protein